MNIAIIGTRGIPNHYGGFEQFAEFLSSFLVENGHRVTVYNSHLHPYQQNKWNGVDIVHCYDPEDKIGTIGQFIYDFNCIIDSRKRNYDIILQLGYTSSSVWGWLMPKKSVIITNMDGLEWKRTKFSPKVQKFLQFAEKLAIKTSDILVSDSIGIQKYLFEKYKVDSTYIAYGAFAFENPNKLILNQYQLIAYQYNMLIARLEPENSIEIILDGVVKSNDSKPLLVIGKHETEFGNYLKNKFSNEPRIIFLGSIYDIDKLNNLRFYSNLYFHGHTVGGTNPSLLEAMASSALIIAHQNDFNQYILKDDGYYFTNSTEVAQHLDLTTKNLLENNKIENNINKIKNEFDWKIINQQYLDLFLIQKDKNY